MTQKQPAYVRILGELVFLLAVVGITTIVWLAFDGGQDWWRRAAPSLLLTYPVRFLAEYWARKQGKPLLRLTEIPTR